MEKLKTGIVQCDDDRPGIFITGEDGFRFALGLTGSEDLKRKTAHQLATLLASANPASPNFDNNSVQHVVSGQNDRSPEKQS